MSAAETLNRYSILSSHLKTRRVNCDRLPEEVEKLTAAALIFEHSSVDSKAPDEQSIRRRARLHPNARMYIIGSNTRNISVVMPDRDADAETILQQSSAFPEYTIRRIYRSPPAPGSSTSPATIANSSTGKLTEVGEVQWYLKAMFHHRCEERAEERARMQRANSLKNDAVKGGKKSKRRRFKGGKNQTLSQESRLDGLGSGLSREVGSSNIRHDQPAPRHLPVDAIPSPLLPPLALPRPPMVPVDAHLSTRPPAPSIGGTNNEESDPVEYQTQTPLIDIALREALDVALEGVPLLESMQTSDLALVRDQVSVVLRVPSDLPIDPHVVSELERVTRLRQNVTDSAHPDIVRLDACIHVALSRLWDCVQRGR